MTIVRKILLCAPIIVTFAVFALLRTEAASVKSVMHSGSANSTVVAGETFIQLFAGVDSENPPVGKSINSLFLWTQGIPVNTLFDRISYDIGIARGTVYVFRWIPTVANIGQHAFSVGSEGATPVPINMNVVEP